jgi:general secretion pathway protein I
MHAERGFTLLEVLVALVLVAVALAALVRTAGTEARNLALLQEGAVAGWVAANVVAETRLRPGLPDPGRSQGRASMAQRQWRWQLDIQATELPEVRRLDVQVFAEGSEQPAAGLTGFATLR